MDSLFFFFLTTVPLAIFIVTREFVSYRIRKLLTIMIFAHAGAIFLTVILAGGLLQLESVNNQTIQENHSEPITVTHQETIISNTTKKTVPNNLNTDILSTEELET
jgi:hypothetical protein